MQSKLKRIQPASFYQMQQHLLSIIFRSDCSEFLRTKSGLHVYPIRVETGHEQDNWFRGKATKGAHATTDFLLFKTPIHSYLSDNYFNKYLFLMP